MKTKKISKLDVAIGLLASHGVYETIKEAKKEVSRLTKIRNSKK